MQESEQIHLDQYSSLRLAAVARTVKPEKVEIIKGRLRCCRNIDHTFSSIANGTSYVMINDYVRIRFRKKRDVAA